LLLEDKNWVRGEISLTPSLLSSPLHSSLADQHQIDHFCKLQRACFVSERERRGVLLTNMDGSFKNKKLDRPQKKTCC
jgi:hypothetical protein